MNRPGSSTADLNVIATKAPTPGAVISRRHTGSGLTIASISPCSLAYSVRNASRARNIGSVISSSIGMPGHQLAHPRHKPALARLAHLQPEPAQNAADAELHIQQLALQQLAGNEQRADLLGCRRLGMHRAGTSPCACNCAMPRASLRSVLFAIADKRCFHMPRLEQDRRQTRRDQASV